MPATTTRPIFGAYDPTALNDAGAPPFPGREDDEEQEEPGHGIDLDYETPQAHWAPIAPGLTPADVPVRFIDGSIVSRTVGSLLVGFRRRPLTAATISAASLQMDGRTMRRGDGVRTRKVLCAHSEGIERDDWLEAAHALNTIGVELVPLPEAPAGGDFDTMRRAVRGKAMQAMEEAEKSVLWADIQTPALVDGLLERRLAATPSHNVPAVGLVKRQMAAYLPTGLQEMVYTLKPAERTPAFVLSTVQHVDLVNCYLRLSAEPGTSPSYGIVRVTAPLAYVEADHPGGAVTAYLSGLATYLYRLRHRDLAYSRAGISITPIVRVEDHLKAIRPDIDALVPKLHRLFLRGGAA